MMILGKHFEFEASHQLPNKECYGKCRNLHGHTYKLVVEIQGEVNPEDGWIMNFSEVKGVVMTQVVDVLDHKHLNDVIGGITTAENILLWIQDRIAKRIWNMGAKLHCLTLYETSKSFAKLYY